MIARILTVILAIFLGLSCPAQDRGDFEFGPRPTNPVFDPTGFLEPAMVKEISDPLAELFQKEGIDVIVVILRDLGKAPPEHVARQFAGAWCKSAIHGVVLHVPDRGESPWIVPGGKVISLINPDLLDQTVAAAQRRAASESNGPDKVRAATTEATDMLRYWTANAVNRSEMIRTESSRMRSELETKSRRWKIALLAAAASVIPLTLCLSLLISILRRRGPGYFPDQPRQLRLGAPHAGGNHAVADLGPPLP